MTGKTLVVGASPNPSRYSYIATERLLENNFDVTLIGIKHGEIQGRTILDIREKPDLPDIHTITMYVGPKNLEPHISYLLSLNPTRIIFNPGSENPELASLAQSKGIVVEYACTLVMLSTGEYHMTMG